MVEHKTGLFEVHLQCYHLLSNSSFPEPDPFQSLLLCSNSRISFPWNEILTMLLLSSARVIVASALKSQKPTTRSKEEHNTQHTQLLYVIRNGNLIVELFHYTWWEPPNVQICFRSYDRSHRLSSMAAQSERDITSFHGLTSTSQFIPLNHGSSSVDHRLLRLDSKL